MNIVVFGANGPTGRHVTQQALDEGNAVTAVTRHPELFPIQHARLQVIQGDVYDLATVEQAVAGKDAVLSSLGVPFSRKPITIYSHGIANIIQAMDDQGVRRLVCVSSTATGTNHETGGGFVFDKILQPLIINTIGQTTYADMKQMETLLRDSDIDWTVVRPSGLFETPAVTRYEQAEDHVRGQFTARADLADCMLRQLTSDQYVRKAVALITTETHPNLFQFFRGETFQSRPGSPTSPSSPATVGSTSH